jgi:hypothetical protein
MSTLSESEEGACTRQKGEQKEKVRRARRGGKNGIMQRE